MLSALLRSLSLDSEELVLDQWRASEFSPSDRLLLEMYPTLTSLSLNGCGLTCLADFPQIPSLLVLQLNDNGIAGGLDALQPLVSLTTLGLCGNPIQSVAVLSPLSALRRLKSLDLLECPVSKLDDYRQAVFDALPTLRTLDRSSQDAGFLSAEDSDESESLYEFESQDEDEEEQQEFSAMLATEEDNCVLIDASSSDEEGPGKKPKTEETSLQ